MPEGYCTGISYPANGTILAPRAAWRAWSGVRLSGAAAAARVTHTPPTERTPERPIAAPSVVDPERFTRTTAQAAARAYSFGERGLPAAFQSALPPAVLLPESFRGGCSFGAADPCSSWGRDLSCGRAYSGAGVAPISAEGQPVRNGAG